MDFIDKADKALLHLNSSSSCSISLINLFHDMDALYSDTILHCVKDGTQLKCHSIVLSGCSEYFANALLDSPSHEIEIHNEICGETMKTILKYMYRKMINSEMLDIENVMDILAAAEHFAMAPLVDSCLEFLSSRTNISTCIDFYKRGWDLNLEGTSRLLQYVATNFTDILLDESSINKLMALPPSLIMDILKSDELIIRGGTTNLFTSPVEREKSVLDFVLEYIAHHHSNLTNGDKTALLKCVRWHLLNIFCEENEEWISMFKYLYSVKHSKWFLSPPGQCKPTAEDKSLYGTRAYTCSELVETSPIIMYPASNTGKTFSIVAQDNEYISNLSLVTQNTGCTQRRTYKGMECEDITGLSITVSSRSGDLNQFNYVGQRRGTLCKVYPMALRKNEHIVEVLATKTKRKKDDIAASLKFVTSKGTKFGPYGIQNGKQKSRPCFPPIMNPVSEKRKNFGAGSKKSLESVVNEELPLHTVLVGVKGTTVRSLEHSTPVIADISFVFRVMLPSSDLLINSSGRYEDFSPFAGGIDDVEQDEAVLNCDCEEFDQEQMLQEMYEYEEIPEHLQ